MLCCKVPNDTLIPFLLSFVSPSHLHLSLLWWGHVILIKTNKTATYPISGSTDFTYKDLMTALQHSSIFVHSRPLTYQTAIPLDDVPLTPNHFSFSHVGGRIAPKSVDSS